jgi:hypothetical protein
MNKLSGFLCLVLPIVGALVGWASPGHTMTVTALDFNDGSVTYHGRYSRIVDRLLDQGGIVTMGEYQPIGDLVPSITKGRTTFSIFTAGFNGAPAPVATVDGSSMTADLSSLFFGVSRGDSIRLWNIGGQATGTFDPETSRFTLSWKDQAPSLWRHGRPRAATFVLEGTAIVGGAPTPVPIPATLALYAGGLFGLGSWGWLTRRRARA